jgi:adenosylhomocysteine nucleosidase
LRPTARLQVSARMKPVLVCFALKEEAAPFRSLASARADVSILITGIGRKNAETAVGQVLAIDKPTFVLTCGLAGGLSPELKIGDLLFAADQPALRKKLTSAGAKSAKFLCAPRVAVRATEKAELRRSTNADAVEMESEAIQALCLERGIPCATVRAISDVAHENLPLDFNQLAKPDLSLDYGKLALAVAKSPGKIPALLRLRKNAKLAAERLADLLAKVIWPP